MTGEETQWERSDLAKGGGVPIMWRVNASAVGGREGDHHYVFCLMRWKREGGGGAEGQHRHSSVPSFISLSGLETQN